MLFILWFASAFAGTLVEEAAWPLSGAAVDVEAVDRDGIPYVVVATRSDVVVLDADGAPVHSLGRGAADVAAYDADGDGAPDLAICAADGLWLVPWTGDGLGSPALVSSVACEVVVAHDLDGASGVAAAAGDDLAVWWDDGAGGLGAVELADVGVLGDPRLASGSGRLAAAISGDDIVWERSAAGEDFLYAGGVVTDIARSDLGWQVALWDARSVGPLGDSSSGATVLSAGPKVLGVGDLDGDDSDDLLVLTDDSMLVWVPGNGTAPQSLPLGEDGAAVAVVDVDADGCDEVVVGLGFSAEAVLVGLEVCPASCDPIVLIEAPEDGVEEGTPATFTASFEACDTAVEGWAWSVDGPDGCVADGASLICTFPDDGPVAISATATSSFGEITGTEEVQVANVAPTLLTGDFVEVNGGVVTARVPCGGSVQLTLYDPGDDVVTVVPAEDGNYTVDASGRLWGPPFEGDVGYIVVQLADEDGGLRVYDLEATTPSCGDDSGWDDTGWGNNPGPEPAGADCCGLCCSLFVFLLFGIRGFGPLTALAVAAE